MNTYITLIAFILCLQIIKVVMLMNVQNVRIILLNVQIIFKKLSFCIVLKLAQWYNMKKGVFEWIISYCLMVLLH